MSRSVEDYLRLLYEQSPEGEVVSVSELAEGLGVHVASVTGMAKRLTKAGLVRRVPYRGLALTEEGMRAALGVVRRHRLIELYLVEAMGYSWDEVHAEADNLEHAASEGFVDRIDQLLGYPEVDTHGSPIPSREGEVVEKAYVPLAGLGCGERVVIRRVLHCDPEMLRHLARVGLTLGAELEVIERHPFEGPLIIDTGGECCVASQFQARHVFVEPVPVRSEEDGWQRRHTFVVTVRP